MATRRRKVPGGRLVDYASSFFSDLQPEGMLHAVLIRSPISTGKIRSVVHPRLPEGYFLYTAKDIPGRKSVSLLETAIPILADAEVSYQGEPVGILVGPDLQLLRRLAGGVVIRFHRMEEDGLSPDAAASQNILASRTVSGGGDAELIFAEGDVQVEGSYSSNCCQSHFGEAAGALAIYKDDSLVLYAPVQWFSQVRRSIADGLGIPPQRVEIRRTLVAGGGQDGSSQWYSAILSAQVAVAAFLCGRPVKLLLDREEQWLYYGRPAPVVVNYRSSVSPEGRVLALIAFIVVDTGICNPFVDEIIDRMVVASLGVYNPPVFKIEAYAVRSRTPPASLSLRRMDSQIFFALESHLHEVARQVGRMPHHVRLLNHRKDPGDPFRFDFSHLERALAAVVERSSFQRKFWSYSLCQAGEARLSSPVPPRGIGVSCAFEGSGFLGAVRCAADLRMELVLEKDGTVVIHSLPPSPAVEAIWTRIVSQGLDVDESSVRIDSDFAGDCEPLHPAGFFGNIGVMIQLLRKCCAAIQRRRFQQALPIRVMRGLTNTQKRQWSQESFSGEPFLSTATGAAVVEVELDPYTYTTIVRGVWVSVEGGEILSMDRATSTVKTAVRESLREFVSLEELEAGSISVDILSAGKGPKQIGGLVHSLLPGAIAAAISQAYSTSVPSIPVEGGYVYRALFPQDAPTLPVSAGHGQSQEESE